MWMRIVLMGVNSCCFVMWLMVVCYYDCFILIHFKSIVKSIVSEKECGFFFFLYLNLKESLIYLFIYFFVNVSWMCSWLFGAAWGEQPSWWLEEDTEENTITDRSGFYFQQHRDSRWVQRCQTARRCFPSCQALLLTSCFICSVVSPTATSRNILQLRHSICGTV